MRYNTFKLDSMMILIIIIVLNYISPSEAQGNITTPPVNTLAHVGDTNVIFKCIGDSSNGNNFYWTYTPFSVGNTTQDYVLSDNGTVRAQFTPLYAILNPNSNEYDLVILNATLAVAGTYRCINVISITRYDYYDALYYYQKAVIFIAVAQLIVIQSNSTCSSNVSVANVGDIVQLNCSITYSGGAFESQGFLPYVKYTGYPPPNNIYPSFSWSLGGAYQGNGTYENFTVSTTPYGIITASSTLLVTAVQGHQSYDCDTIFGMPTNPRGPGSATNAPNYNKNCTATFETPLTTTPLTTTPSTTAKMTTLSIGTCLWVELPSSGFLGLHSAQVGISNSIACQGLCIITSGCLGCEFDTSKNCCYLNTVASNTISFNIASTSTYYSLFKASGVTSLCSSAPICTWTGQKNMYILAVLSVPGISNINACIDYCQSKGSSCIAVQFNYNTNGCSVNNPLLVILENLLRPISTLLGFYFFSGPTCPSAG